MVEETKSGGTVRRRFLWLAALAAVAVIAVAVVLVVHKKKQAAPMQTLPEINTNASGTGFGTPAWLEQNEANEQYVTVDPGDSYVHVTYKPEVKIVDASASDDSLAGISSDGHGLVFVGAPPEIRALKAGDVFMVKDEFAVKVLGAETDGDQTVLLIDRANLTDVVQEGDIHINAAIIFHGPATNLASAEPASLLSQLMDLIVTPAYAQKPIILGEPTTPAGAPKPLSEVTKNFVEDALFDGWSLPEYSLTPKDNNADLKLTLQKSTLGFKAVVHVKGTISNVKFISNIHFPPQPGFGTEFVQGVKGMGGHMRFQWEIGRDAPGVWAKEERIALPGIEFPFQAAGLPLTFSIGVAFLIHPALTGGNEFSAGGYTMDWNGSGAPPPETNDSADCGPPPSIPPSPGFGPIPKPALQPPPKPGPFQPPSKTQLPPDLWSKIKQTIKDILTSPSQPGPPQLPAAGSPAPSSGTPGPSSGPQQPSSGTQEPTSETQEPSSGPQQPSSGTQEPSPGTQQPSPGTQQPSSGAPALPGNPAAPGTSPPSTPPKSKPKTKPPAMLIPASFVLVSGGQGSGCSSGQPLQVQDGSANFGGGGGGSVALRFAVTGDSNISPVAPNAMVISVAAPRLELKLGLPRKIAKNKAVMVAGAAVDFVVKKVAKKIFSQETYDKLAASPIGQMSASKILKSSADVYFQLIHTEGTTHSSSMTPAPCTKMELKLTGQVGWEANLFGMAIVSPKKEEAANNPRDLFTKTWYYWNPGSDFCKSL